MRSQLFFGSAFYCTIVISYCQEISTSSNDFTTVLDVDYDDGVYDMQEDTEKTLEARETTSDEMSQYSMGIIHSDLNAYASNEDNLVPIEWRKYYKRNSMKPRNLPPGSYKVPRMALQGNVHYIKGNVWDEDKYGNKDKSWNGHDRTHPFGSSLNLKELKSDRDFIEELEGVSMMITQNVSYSWPIISLYDFLKIMFFILIF